MSRIILSDKGVERVEDELAPFANAQELIDSLRNQIEAFSKAHEKEFDHFGGKLADFGCRLDDLENTLDAAEQEIDLPRRRDRLSEDVAFSGDPGTTERLSSDEA